jgi:hypothetical protein
MRDHTHALTVEYHWHDDHILQVSLYASNGRFSGAALPYLGHGELTALAEALRHFPEKAPVECELGQKNLEWARLTFFAVGSARHGAVRAEIYSQEASVRAKHAVQKTDLQLELDPAQIDRLCRSLRHIDATKGNVSTVSDQR